MLRPPRRVSVSARGGSGSHEARVEQLLSSDGLIELWLRLGDGSTGLAILFDDDVNSAELEAGATVFIRAAHNPPRERRAATGD